MICLLEKCLPVEVIVRVLQLLDEEGTTSLITAYPGLIEKYPIIREFITARTALELVLKEHGFYVVNKHQFPNFVEILDESAVRSIHVFDEKIKRKQLKTQKFLLITSVAVMIKLKRVKIVHHDGELMIKLLELLPESVIVLEIVLDGVIKDNWKFMHHNRIVSTTQQREETLYRCENLHKKRNLKMVTIINLVKKNRKKIEFIKTKYIARQIKLRPVVTDTDIIERSVGVRYEHQMISDLGMMIARLIQQSKLTIQNIGVFGIDAIWIMAKVGIEFPQLRIVKTGGESMTRTILWANDILRENNQKKIFLNDHYARPMVVMFSKMFDSRCKVYLSDSNSYYVTGTGVKLFEEFTYV